MIVQEVWRDDFVFTYSDAKVYIRQVETGEIYADAVDTIPVQYTYEETDKPLPKREYDE